MEGAYRRGTLVSKKSMHARISLTSSTLVKYVTDELDDFIIEDRPGGRESSVRRGRTW
jgi:hypothetical protein